MVTVFAREFKRLFKNTKAIVCIAVFAFASAVLFLTNNLLNGYSGIQSVFSSMSLVAALTIPAVAASSLTDEKKSGGESFLAALPITPAEMVLGKFLGIFAFFMIPTAILAIYPFILSLNGVSNIYVGYIILPVFILAEVFFIALGLMVSAISKRGWKAIVVTYAILAVLFIVGMFAALTSGFFEEIMRFVSPFRRFDPVVFDLLDISSVLFYVTLSALFLAVTVGIVSRSREGEVRIEGSKVRTTVVAAVLVGVMLCINVGAVLMPESTTSLDISSNDIYEISDTTVEYLKSIDEDVTVYLLNPTAGEEKLHAYIRRYCEQSKHITLKEVDTTKDTEFLTSHDINSTPSMYSILIESGRRTKLIDSESFFSYYHSEIGFMSPSDYIYGINYYQQMYTYYQQMGASSSDLTELYDMIESLANESIYCFNPEDSITAGIEYVLADNIPTVYFASGHGEKNNAGNPIDISKISDMPQDAVLLIINAPATDYTDSEIAMLQRYSDRGGKLIVISDPKFAEMENLSRFMSGFGLSIVEALVTVDDKTSVTAAVNNTSDAFSGLSIEELKMSNASSIVTSAVEGLEYTPLMAVTEKNGEETTTKILGVSVTRNKSPKLIWISGADTFNVDVNSLNEEEKKQYTNAGYCIQSSVLWLRTEFKSKLSFPSPKPYVVQMISVSSGTTTLFGIIFVGIIPFGLIGVSYALRYTRKKRSRAVKIVD